MAEIFAKHFDSNDDLQKNHKALVETKCDLNREIKNLIKKEKKMEAVIKKMIKEDQTNNRNRTTAQEKAREVLENRLSIMQIKETKKKIETASKDFKKMEKQMAQIMASASEAILNLEHKCVLPEMGGISKKFLNRLGRKMLNVELFGGAMGFARVKCISDEAVSDYLRGLEEQSQTLVDVIMDEASTEATETQDDTEIVESVPGTGTASVNQPTSSDTSKENGETQSVSSKNIHKRKTGTESKYTRETKLLHQIDNTLELVKVEEKKEENEQMNKQNNKQTKNQNRNVRNNTNRTKSRIQILENVSTYLNIRLDILTKKT